MTITAELLLPLLETDLERRRYSFILGTLVAHRALFAGRRALDFGASWGTSAIALSRAGASEVVGVEPVLGRVERGRQLIARAAPGVAIAMHHVEDTLHLPFKDGEFPFVLANGVIEHIPQPRDAYLREVWRVLAPEGHLMITETPNKYFPKDQHTTQLWLNHWLPSRLAHRRAIWWGRFRAERTDWASSGWRGLSYPELVRPLRNYRHVPSPLERWRHTVLNALGLPAELIDPWPVWIIQKTR